MMTIDLSALQGLKDGSPEWEAARAKLIRDYIETCPKERQLDLMEFQSFLEEARSTMTSAEFLTYLQQRLIENLQNLDDQLRYLVSTVNGPPGSQPKP
jgi:hypothetical protein